MGISIGVRKVPGRLDYRGIRSQSGFPIGSGRYPGQVGDRMKASDNRGQIAHMAKNPASGASGANTSKLSPPSLPITFTPNPGPAYRAVPHRRWRKRSHGENRTLSANKPMATIIAMTPITCSMAFSSRP